MAETDPSFDFDTVYNRRDTDSLKWARYAQPDVIPLWVADMDFRAPDPILAALHGRVDHGIFGYASPPAELVPVIQAWLQAQYRWEIDPAWIVWLPGAVPALNVVCRAYGEPGDEVLTFTPIYPPFLAAPPHAGKGLRTVPLRREGQLYTPDAEELAQALSPRSRILLLCNPHNPVGRRYERRELERIAEVCVAHDLIVCSDEIHCDLILDGGRHVPTATLGPEVAARTITLMAPSKTFNVPGLNCAFALIPNPALRTKFKEAREGIVPGTNVLGFTACLAAYRDGEPWRRALIEYLRGNRDLVRRAVCTDMPGLAMDDVQATYLAWIDTRRLGLARPARFFEQAGVALFDGRAFQGEGFVRLNFACPRRVLQEALERMQQAVRRRGGPAGEGA
ncbi:MAG: PatB family C-S lyase [Planctomycetes bacterium]|nr:PatB family C-S lyase [Planctomycetota bacterium]